MIKLPPGTDINLMKVVVGQDVDSCAPIAAGAANELELEVMSPDGDEGYLVINTERWALDREDIPGFCAMLKSVFDMTARGLPAVVAADDVAGETETCVVHRAVKGSI